MRTAVKFAKGSDDRLEILAVPFFGPVPSDDGKGRDLDGEFFSPRTDLCLDWFPESRPLLYNHGQDGELGAAIVGRLDSSTVRKAVDGYWVQAQLDKASAYYAAIKELVKKAALGASSGALGYLVETSKGGEIRRWPWVELSLTPTPANPYARVEATEAAKHFKAIGQSFAPPAAKANPAAHETVRNHFHEHPGGAKHSHPHLHAAGDPSHDAHPAMKAMKQADGSYEDIQNRLNLALMNAGWGYAYVVATFADRFVVQITSEDDTEYYEIPYTVDAATDELTLGQPTEVEMQFVEAPDADDTELNSGIEPGAGDAMKRARRALADARRVLGTVKSSRVLSAANLRDIQAAHDCLKSVMGRHAAAIGRQGG